MKQVIVIRTDLDMSPGKMIAQGSHASLNSYLEASEEDQKNWMATGHKKVVVKVTSEQKLINICAKAHDAELPTFMVEDWGLTEVDQNTKTAVAIGPARDDLIDKVTKRLSLL
jgi:PTH2 family peptidyl-tRNA hydrolase